MKQCNQAKDWSVSLFGETLPKFILYGSVNRKVFTCDIFTGRLETGRKNHHTYIIKVRDEKRNKWETTDTRKHGDIFLAIENYCRLHEIEGEKIEVCPHKKYWADKSKEAAKKFVARGILRAEEEAREIRKSGPQEKKAQNDFSLYGAYDNTKKGTFCETDRVFTYEMEGCHASGTLTCVQDTGLHFKSFEQGQNSAGTVHHKIINGRKCPEKYVRSGWETKDGCLTGYQAVKESRAEKARNTKKISGDIHVNHEELIISRGLTNRDEFRYMVANEPEATKKVMANPFIVASLATRMAK